MYRAGIDIGGTKIKIGILDETNRLVGSKKLSVNTIDNLVNTLWTEITTLCTENQIAYNQVVSCGIGVPGTVSEDGRRLIKAPNISLLSENLATELEEKLGIPTAMVQDSRAAAWGEYLCGAGQGADCVVCVTLGTGIGTGIVLNGKIYHGSLGNAGELGHIPVLKDGRNCGCGKCGCLEKYAAGGGLDITADELLGPGKTAYDLFEAAKSGNYQAKLELEKAVELLGNAMVGMINLLSPSCVLFSGGLSQREEYVNPLIDYIKSHCYTSGKSPEIKLATLGENAPLIGAALIPIRKKRTPFLSASIMCADSLNYAKALKEIALAGIQYIHCDIMDNCFVPNMMLPPELLNKLRATSTVPFDYHIMAEKPETIIERLLIQEGDFVSVHAESTKHLEKAIHTICEKGGKAAVAINPGTPIEIIREVLNEVSMVLLMTVNPGFSGQTLVPGAFDKIKRTRDYLDSLGYQNILIEVDGNCSFENIPKMYQAGADILVAGTSSIFKKGLEICQGVDKVNRLLQL